MTDGPDFDEDWAKSGRHAAAIGAVVGLGLAIFAFVSLRGREVAAQPDPSRTPCRHQCPRPSRNQRASVSESQSPAPRTAAMFLR